METETHTFTRRRFLQYTGALGALAGLNSLVPAYAWPGTAAQASDATRQGAPIIDLLIRRHTIPIGARQGTAVTVNGSVPGPLLRLREGETVTIRVTNQLEDVTSIHWHGILLPHDMDGVPGVSFPGIQPGETFTYRYPVKQSGTYWYHSHSGLQEQAGLYGPLIIDPAEPDPIAYDREYVAMLSDWTFENPHDVLMKLKKQSDYYNFQQRTIGDFFRDVSEKGWRATISDRLMWGRMRMDPADISDVTGDTYTYLINGRPPEANWTALFRPGERVRLRFINGSAMTYFNVRMPGLAMTVVQADGQNVEPVTVDEFQIAVAETYDVIVEPKEDRAFTIFAESMDRSGYTRGTLAPREGMSAAIPKLRERPLRTMVDMGMDMGDMGQMKREMDANAKAGGGHTGMDMGSGSTAGGGQMGAMPGMGEKVGPVVARQGPNRYGPGNTTVAAVERNRLGEPGTGLGNVGHRVLVYTDLRSVKPGDDQRQPGREIELHLTGNMDKFMWSFDGQKFSEAREPIPFNYGERLRFTMVNDTMMEHPIHLHGMFMELDNGSGSCKPRKHTVNVKPAERLSVEITADAPGNWALHCHLLYHMEMGMFRVVNVSRRVAHGDK
jgi:CopA family copper-resistance protein